MPDKQRDCFAIIAPDGHIMADSSWTEDDAWRIGLGWPDAAEIAHAKQCGWSVVRCRVIVDDI